jgi:hypothetical protein
MPFAQRRDMQNDNRSKSERLAMGKGIDKGVGRCPGCGGHDSLKEYERVGVMCPVCEAEHKRFRGVMSTVEDYFDDLIKRGIAHENDFKSLDLFLPKRLVG